MEFMSIQNYQLCNQIFCKYMQDQYSVNVSITDNPDMKRTLYNVMQGIGKTQNGDLKTMNNAVLNEMRDVCLNKLNISTNRKPRVRNLERDQDVYGSRAVQLGEQIKPTMNPPRRDEVKSKSIDDINAERASINASAPATLPFNVVKVPDAPSTHDFIKRVEEIEAARQRDLPPPDNQRLGESFEISRLQQNEISDPKALYTDNVKRIELNAPVQTPYVNYSQESLITPVKDTHEKKTYIIINGHDRNWEQEPLRYSFSINVDSFSKTLKNITEISITRLVVPMEVLGLKKTVMNPDGVRYYNQYGLTYPYLMLQIDEFSPTMYQGLNKTTQKCFTTFIYEHDYKATNGRGFIVMKPMQDEKKEYTTPINMLPRMTIRIVKPNGTLYNVASDENCVDVMTYESMNPLLVRLKCKDYFDANEYTVGDVVLVKNFIMFSPQEFASLVAMQGQGVVSNGDLSKYASGIGAIETFMNRDEGHEIVVMGEPNTNTFMNTFAVFLPRMLDKSAGVLVLQRDIFECIDVCMRYLSYVPHKEKGYLLNMTLQVVLSMKIKNLTGDFKHTELQATNI